MILTIHAVAGAAVANQFQNKLIAWVLAFLSHFLLDAIPHKDYDLSNAKLGLRDKKFWMFILKAMIDLLIGFILIIIFTKEMSNLKHNLIGGFIALIPDGLTLLYFIIKPNNKILKILSAILEKFYYNFHKSLGWLENTPLFWGILSQVIILIISLYSLINW